jgi:hypothetical protein
MLLELLGNSDLFRIGWFAEQHFAIGVNGVRERIRISNFGNWRLLPHDIQEGPWQIFPCAQIDEDAFDCSRKPQVARTQEQHWVAANTRVVCFLVRRLIFKKLSAW